MVKYTGIFMKRKGESVRNSIADDAPFSKESWIYCDCFAATEQALFCEIPPGSILSIYLMDFIRFRDTKLMWSIQQWMLGNCQSRGTMDKRFHLFGFWHIVIETFRFICCYTSQVNLYKDHDPSEFKQYRRTFYFPIFEISTQLVISHSLFLSFFISLPLLFSLYVSLSLSHIPPLLSKCRHHSSIIESSVSSDRKLCWRGQFIKMSSVFNKYLHLSTPPQERLKCKVCLTLDFMSNRKRA